MQVTVFKKGLAAKNSVRELVRGGEGRGEEMQQGTHLTCVWHFTANRFHRHGLMSPTEQPHHASRAERVLPEPSSRLPASPVTHVHLPPALQHRPPCPRPSSQDRQDLACSWSPSQPSGFPFQCPQKLICSRVTHRCSLPWEVSLGPPFLSIPALQVPTYPSDDRVKASGSCLSPGVWS